MLPVTVLGWRLRVRTGCWVCVFCLLVILTLQGTSEEAPVLGCLLVRGLRVLVRSPGPSPVCRAGSWKLLLREGRLPTL